MKRLLLLLAVLASLSFIAALAIAQAPATSAGIPPPAPVGPMAPGGITVFAPAVAAPAVTAFIATATATARFGAVPARAPGWVLIRTLVAATSCKQTQGRKTKDEFRGSLHG